MLRLISRFWWDKFHQKERSEESCKSAGTEQSRSGLYIYRERTPASTFNSEGVACYSSSRISINIEILRIFAAAIWIFEPKKTWQVYSTSNAPAAPPQPRSRQRAVSRYIRPCQVFDTDRSSRGDLTVSETCQGQTPPKKKERNPLRPFINSWFQNSMIQAINEFLNVQIFELLQMFRQRHRSPEADSGQYPVTSDPDRSLRGDLTVSETCQGQTPSQKKERNPLRPNLSSFYSI